MEYQSLLRKITNILENLKIPYLVTGGTAVVVWGRPRYTADIDIVIELKKEKVKGLIEVLIKEGYIDEGAVEEALIYKSEFNFIDESTGVKVDFWILKNDDFDKSRLKRRVKQDIFGQKIYFASPEDLILTKLLWFEESKSTRHLEDIQSVLAITKNELDSEYLKNWAKKHKTLGLLEEMISLMDIKP